MTIDLVKLHLIKETSAWPSQFVRDQRVVQVGKLHLIKEGQWPSQFARVVRLVQVVKLHLIK